LHTLESNPLLRLQSASGLQTYLRSINPGTGEFSVLNYIIRTSSAGDATVNEICLSCFKVAIPIEYI
jgi:hypothetical protein